MAVVAPSAAALVITASTPQARHSSGASAHASGDLRYRARRRRARRADRRSASTRCSPLRWRPDGPLLLCYDGSDDGRPAIEAAARLFAGREAVVACFWQPFAAVAKRFAVSLLEVVQEADDINEREAALAQQIADEGAAIARRGGFDAQGMPSR